MIHTTRANDNNVTYHTSGGTGRGDRRTNNAHHPTNEETRSHGEPAAAGTIIVEQQLLGG
jgi:hypothetical protein